MKAPCVFQIETGKLAWSSLDECFWYEARYAGWHMEKTAHINANHFRLHSLSSRSMYSRTNVAIVAVWCALFSDRKCCFGVDCFRIELAVAIQMCCEHDTQTIRFRLDSIVKILYNKKNSSELFVFRTGQTFHLQIWKLKLNIAQNCKYLDSYGHINRVVNSICDHFKIVVHADNLLHCNVHSNWKHWVL